MNAAPYGKATKHDSVRERNRRRALGAIPRRTGRDPVKARAAWKRADVRRRAERHALVDRLKSKPCEDCGVRYPPHVMQFDHRPGTVKLGIIAIFRGRPGLPVKKLLAEVAKCDVVCANCHAARTHRRLRKAA